MLIFVKRIYLTLSWGLNPNYDRVSLGVMPMKEYSSQVSRIGKSPSDAI